MTPEGKDAASVVDARSCCFGDVPPGMGFHFSSEDGIDLAAYVKIDPARARAQFGGAVIEVAPESRVRLIEL